MSQKSNITILKVLNLVIQFFVETFVAMVIGYFIGKYLDKWFLNDKVILTYIFVVIGIFAGISNFVKRALKSDL